MSERRVWALWAAALLIPAAAFAHARLTHSTPADGSRLDSAPAAVVLQFSEAPEVALTTITLSAQTGGSIPLGPVERVHSAARSVSAKILEPLAPGAYKISWATAAADGHPSRGTLAFEVVGSPANLPAAGASTGPRTDSVWVREAPSVTGAEAFGVESPLYVVVRWVHFLAILIVVGAVSFRQLVLPYLKRKEEPDSMMIPEAARSAARIGQTASAALLAVSVVRFVLQSYLMHGGMRGVAPDMLRSMLTETAWGEAWLLGLFGVAVAGLGFYKARSADISRWWNVATFGAVVVAFSPAFAGHASASPRLTALAIFADGLHVISAGGWLGGLLLVLSAGIPAALRLPKEQRGPMVAEVVNAFSPTALVFAGIIGATGVFAAWLHLGLVSALWTSAYGKTLLVKLAVLSVVGVTGAYNWLRVKPRLGHVDGTQRMKRSAVIELSAGVLVVLVTAVLVAVSTPHEADVQDAPPAPAAHTM